MASDADRPDLPDELLCPVKEPQLRCCFHQLRDAEVSTGVDWCRLILRQNTGPSIQKQFDDLQLLPADKCIGVEKSLS